ncbi:Alpha-tubulin N-acetyltransferase 1 [Gryganskiella cystojenkinii]|nr:Alpha-tubulin N-acetyltransferase 1 [Gryganskiella cystojenkinii]
MDFDFPLIPILPQPITLIPATTFAALEHQHQIQRAYVSTVSIGLSANAVSPYNIGSTSQLFSQNNGSSAGISDQEKLGAIVDALGEASAKAQELPTSITQRLRLAKNPTQRVYILRTGLENGEDQWLEQLEIGSAIAKQTIQKHAQGRTQQRQHEQQPIVLTRNSRPPQQQPTPDSEQSLSPVDQQDTTATSQPRSRSEEKGVYVAGMLKIGEKKLFIVDKHGTMHEQDVCCVLDFYVDESFQRQGFGKLLFDYMIKVEEIQPTQIAYDRPSPKLYQFLSKYFQLDRHLPQPNQFAIFEGFKLEDCGQIIEVNGNDLYSNLGRTGPPPPRPTAQDAFRDSSYTSQLSNNRSSFRQQDNQGQIAAERATSMLK